MTSDFTSMMRNGGGMAVNRLRRDAIDIHRAFSELHPVIQRTRMLSLNAVVASARTGVTGDSFGIIANELSRVAVELSRLIGEMEGLFHTVVSHVARTVQAEDRCRLYRRALARLLENAQADLRNNMAALVAEQQAPAPRPAALPAPIPAASTPHIAGTQRDLLAQIERNEAQFLADLREVEALCHQLTQRINRINWVAVRQSHITAVAAQIEAARAAKGSGLMEVARIVRDLAAQIAVTESAAKEKIEDLQALAVHVVQPLRGDGLSAFGGVAS